MLQFTLNVERGEEHEDDGLWIITSDDAVVGGRLFIAGKSLREALSAVPEGINDLQAAKLESAVAAPDDPHHCNKR
jgi:hypothetical protein